MKCRKLPVLLVVKASSVVFGLVVRFAVTENALFDKGLQKRFQANLALTPEQEIYSKAGIILGSIVSAIMGSLFLAISLLPSRKGSVI